MTTTTTIQTSQRPVDRLRAAPPEFGGRRATLRAMVCFALLVPAGCGSDDERVVTDTNAATDGRDQQAAEPPPPLPDIPSATCRVYTETPGAFVFIDGTRVAGADGDPINTPCRVRAARGSHVVTVAQQGRTDQSQQIVFDGTDLELYFEDPGMRNLSASSLLSAPLLDAPIGVPVPLETLNTPGRELDPYVTPDGLSIWYAADGPDGRGIYVATRQSPLEQFGPGRFLQLTRGADLPASPSLTGDQRSVVYVIPDKARIWALTRPSPLGDFDDRHPLFFRSDSEHVRWPSAQIHRDGLRLYFVRETAESSETRVAIRASLVEDFREERIVEFPGRHPCLSSDGLRQYLFDGATLSRARRATIRDSFSTPESVIDLHLPGYAASQLYRQFWVSDDEQWMFYSDDPDRAGDLFVVRLASGPGWGVALSGEPIEQKLLAETMNTTERPIVSEAPTPEPDESADPRSQPLPYTQFRTRLVELIQNREFDAAAEFVASAGAFPELPPDAELVGWDREDVARLQQFWDDVHAAATGMRPGDEFRIGSVRVEFVSFENGRLVAKARTRELQRDLAELDALNILEIVDPARDASDADHQIRATTFLVYEPDLPLSSRDRRVAAGGEGAAEVLERFAIRLLEQARAELERDNTAQAVVFIDRVETEFPDTETSGQAAELRNQLYEAAWRLAGNREWRRGPEGEYTADDERVDDALVISRKEYERFELSMEYRTNSRNGQGGVFFRYAGSGRTYGRCFKIQLTNDRGVAVDEYCTGSLFGIEAPLTNAAGEMGQWNTFRMRVDGEDFTVWINDRIVIDSDAVDNAIPETGYVALDGIPGGISYRKVLLSNLTP